MEEKKKDGKLEALVGEENANLLRQKIDAADNEFMDKLATLTNEHSEAMRVAMLATLSSCGTWSEAQMDKIMSRLRAMVLDGAVCSVLTIAGVLQAESPIAMSAYALHALNHYETGITELTRMDTMRSIKDLLGMFGSPKPPQAEETDAKV